MKKIFTLFLCLTFILGTGYSQKRKINSEGKYKGVIRIKFSPKAKQKVEALNKMLLEKKQLKVTAQAAFVRTNIPNLDRVNQQFSANKMRRVFRNAGKFESKHR